MVTAGEGLATVTVKVHCEPSPVVHVTVVVPFGKLDPEGGEQVTATALPQTSVAVAEKFTTAEQWPESVPVTILAGQLMVVEEFPDGANLNVTKSRLPFAVRDSPVTTMLPAPSTPTPLVEDWNGAGKLPENTPLAAFCCQRRWPSVAANLAVRKWPKESPVTITLSALST